MMFYKVVSYVLAVSWIIAVTVGDVLEDDFLTVVDGRGGDLYQLSLDGSVSNKLLLSQHIHPVAVDYDPLNNRVYWTDIAARSTLPPTINSAYLNGTDQKTLLQLSSSSSPEGIAVDPKMQLLFYTDNGLDAIRAVTLDGDYETTVVNSAHNPRDLQIDVINRQIYWTDWGKGTIERSNYDGSERGVLYSLDSAWFNGLSLDLISHEVYWTDAKNDLVMSANLNGTSVQTVLDAGSWQPSPHYYAIAVAADYIYLTNWNQKQVGRISRDGHNYTSIGPEFTMLNGIHVYQSSSYKYGGNSPCTENKAECSDLCLPLTNSDYICACIDGKALAPDQKTCVVEEYKSGPDLIWLEIAGSSSSYIRGIKGEPKTFLSSSSLESWRIYSPSWHWKAVDFSIDEELLYMVNGLSNEIAQLSMNGSLLLQEVVTSGLSTSVNSLSYDWLSKSLYWTDSLYNWIRVCSVGVRTQNIKTLIKSGLDTPHGIAVHPHKGLLFWTDWGEVDKIERSTLAGEERKVLISFPANIVRPTGISVDYAKDRIYWSNQQQLMSATLDGTDITTHYSSVGVNLGGITFHDTYIIAVDKGISGSKPYIIFLNVNSPNRVPKLALDKAPADVLMYHGSRQPKLKTKTMVCESCSQICISDASLENHTQCMCRDGYILDANGKTCTLDTQTLDGFIFSIGDRICSVPYEQIHQRQDNPEKYCFFESSGYRFAALDFGYNEAVIFFSEINYKTKTIRRASLNDKTNNTVIVYGVGEVYGLAYDYLAGNIYWTDYTLGQIWMARSDGSYQKTLIYNRNKPRALVLNMVLRKLYWSEDSSDNNQQNKIMSSNLDGSDVQLFVGNNLTLISGLALDYVNNRLYWVDKRENEVEYIYFDGTDRTTVLSLSDQGYNTYDVALYNGFVGLTDVSSTNQSGFHVLENNSGFKPGTGVTYSEHSAAYDIVAFVPDGQRLFVSRNCSFDNGFCEQLCVQVTDDTMTCACMNGMVLADDMKNCVPATIYPDKFLLIANDYQHTIHLMDPKNLTSYSSLKLPPQDRPISVTYDPIEKRVYWSDFNSGVIKRMFLNGSKVEVVNDSGKDSRVDGLIFEPNSRLLYYSDTDNSRIGVISPDGSHHKVLHTDARNLANIRAMVLDSANGYLYYATRGVGYAKIIRADMTTYNTVELVNTSLKWPSGLVLDKLAKKLYWIDSQTHMIEVINTNGSERSRVLQLNSNADPFGFALVGNILYWTDWTLRGLFSVKTDGMNQSVIHETTFPALNDIHYIDSENIPESTVCSVNNGDCSHLCIPIPGGVSCQCPDINGISIKAGDGQNCTSPGCTAIIPNGNFDRACTMVIGSSCNYTCNSGYGPTTTRAIQCMPGFTWSVAVDLLCSSTSCPSVLETPPHSQLDLTSNCHRAIVGDTCRFKCQAGFKKTGGDENRICLTDQTWSGAEIQCSRDDTCSLLGSKPSNTRVDPTSCHSTTASNLVGQTCTYNCDEGFEHVSGNLIRSCGTNLVWSGEPPVCVAITTPTTPTTNPTTTTTTTSTTTTSTTTFSTTEIPTPGVQPTVGTGSVKDLQSGSSTVLPVTVGLVLAVVFIAAFIVVLAVILYRRSHKPSARYENFDGTITNDREPVVFSDPITPSYNVEKDQVFFGNGQEGLNNNNVYVSSKAGNGHVKSDGSVEFDNPGYGTSIPSKFTEDSGSSNLYTEIDNGAIGDNPRRSDDIDVVIPEDQSRTAFSNPMYANIPESNIDLGDITFESVS